MRMLKAVFEKNRDRLLATPAQEALARSLQGSETSLSIT